MNEFTSRELESFNGKEGTAFYTSGHTEEIAGLTRAKGDGKGNWTTMLKIKRIYDPASPEDGRRIYVDRLWAQGDEKGTREDRRMTQRFSSERCPAEVVRP
jgi:hypothetical protein